MKKTKKPTKEQLLIQLIAIKGEVLLNEIKANLWLIALLIIVSLTFIIQDIAMERFILASLWFILMLGFVWLFISKFRFYKSVKKSEEVWLRKK